MKTFAKIIRILTVSPIMALMLCLVLYFDKNINFASLSMFFVCIACLCVLPVVAYPVEKCTHIFAKISGQNSQRQCERKLAICFSILGYIILTIVCFATNQSSVLKQMSLTYLFSGILIFVFSVIIKINASGHVCGVVGPIVFLTHFVSLYFLFLLLLLVPVCWGSLKLARHSKLELLCGGIIPVVSFLIAITLI